MGTVMRRILCFMLAICLAACNLNNSSDSFGAAPIDTSPPIFQSEVGMGTTRVITLEQVGEIEAGTRVHLGVVQQGDDGWIYSISTDDNQLAAVARESQLAWAPGEIPGAPTPTMRFSSDTSGVYRFMTTVDVGDIPANTRVRVQETRWENNVWVYVIVTEDERQTAEATDGQLVEAPASMPNANFSSDIANGFRFVTTESVGNIPTGTLVTIGEAIMRNNEWIYVIFTEDNRRAEAHDWQLEYAPFVTPGFVPTAMFQSELGMGTERVITLEQIGVIPAGTKVRISTATFDGREWVYTIVMDDDRTFADARESQLRWAPNETPGAPTPTAGLQGAGMGYRYVTTEQVGDIPAGTSVAVSMMWMRENVWVYGIVTESGLYGEAHESQLRLSPDITPGPTPTTMFQSELGMNVYRVITLVQVGAIPANTRVRVSMAMFNGRGWVYTIATSEGIYEEASASQIAYAPGETPGAPTPSATP
jgi:hypothetical protein